MSDPPRGGRPAENSVPDREPVEHAPPPPPPGPPPGQYGRGGASVPGPYGPRPGSDDTTMAMLAHLCGIFTGFLGPLVLYLVKKDQSPYVRDQSAEALNFQITLHLAEIGGVVLAFLAFFWFFFGFFLIFPLVLVLITLVIGAVVLMILAAVAANRGERYRYPINIRFVK